MSLLESYKPGTKDYKIWFDAKKIKIEDQTKSLLQINYSALLHKYINKHYFIN